MFFKKTKRTVDDVVEQLRMMSYELNEIADAKGEESDDITTQINTLEDQKVRVEQELVRAKRISDKIGGLIE